MPVDWVILCNSQSVTAKAFSNCASEQNWKLSNTDFCKWWRNFPCNLYCSSSAPFGSSDHSLVKANISLAIMRASTQHCKIWLIAQIKWQELPRTLSQMDWAAICTASDIDSAEEYFHKSRLSHEPGFSKPICGDTIHSLVHGVLNAMVRQLSSSSLISHCGKLTWLWATVKLTRSTCLHLCIHQKKHGLDDLKAELSFQSPSSQAWWRLIKSVSGVCSPLSPHQGLCPRQGVISQFGVCL